MVAVMKREVRATERKRTDQGRQLREVQQLLKRREQEVA